MTVEELERIYAHLDDRYMTRSECAANVSREEEKISKIDVKFARLDTKVTWLVGIMGAIGAAVIPLCIKLIFGG